MKLTHRTACRTRVRLAASLTAALLFCNACNQNNPPAETTGPLDSIPVPAISEDTAPIAEPVFPMYPFTFFTEDGEEITVELPCDPERDAELHACTLDASDALYHVILYRAPSETDGSTECARVFSYEDGREYPVVPVDEILSRYVTVTSEDGFWRMTVNGASFEVSHAQFSEEDRAQLAEMPDLTQAHDFYIENGQLFCRVSLMCGGAEPLYAAETLRIRFAVDGETVAADEITFERQELPADDTESADEAE